MPIYEYICKKCDHLFEEIVFDTYAHPQICPRCGHPEVVRVMSVFASSSNGSFRSSSESSCGSCTSGNCTSCGHK